MPRSRPPNGSGPIPEDGAVASEPDRRQRADGRRNQARVLEAAFAAFATHGASVSIREIARRAGVSTGTVSRHFPTKEALFRAVAVDRIGNLVQRADELAASGDPENAFFEFFALLVRQGAADHAVGDALVGAGFDIRAAASAAAHDFMAAMTRLLAQAQEAGAVRDDVDTADVKALIVGCLARESTDGVEQQRMIEIARDGLRPRPVRRPHPERLEADDVDGRAQ